MKKSLLLAVSSFVLLSCTNTNEHSAHKHADSTHEGHNQEVTSPEEHQHGAIELNKGEKWVVNPEMKPYVLKGEELVNTYIQNSQKTFTILATELKEQNYQLIKSCTMEGKSHDELHKWLHPHLDLVKALDTETDPVKAEAIILNIQKSYTEYHTYFN